MMSRATPIQAKPAGAAASLVAEPPGPVIEPVTATADDPFGMHLIGSSWSPPVQAKLEVDAGAAAITPASGGGSGLAGPAQAQMERAFGADFSDVRVHTDSDQATALGARAFTAGSDLHFAPGQYAPESGAGLELLGHELAHVVQQRDGRVAAPAQASGNRFVADQALEREADELGARAARGEHVGGGSGGGGGGGGAVQPMLFVQIGPGMYGVARDMQRMLGMQLQPGQLAKDGGIQYVVVAHDGDVVRLRREDGQVFDYSLAGDAYQAVAPAQAPVQAPVPVVAPVAVQAPLPAAVVQDGGGGGGGGGGGDADAEAEVEAEGEDNGGEMDVDDVDFPYSIKKGTYASFDAVGAARTNAVNSTQAIANPKAAGPAYIGNVPTIGRGKDKTPVDVAAQYLAEAFDNPAHAAARMALVVGVNRKESVTQAHAPQVATVTAMVDAVAAFQGFPLAADAHLWKPQWIENGTGEDADFETVRAAAAENPVAARVAEAAGEPQIPAGEARTQLAASASTAAYLAHMNARFQQAYVHVGDPDAINLKAAATPDDPATGLFDRFDTVLGDHVAAGNTAPILASGGYRFRQTGQGADPHAGEARKGVAQTVANNEIDMAVRDAVGGVNAAVSYMPEPNLLIRGDQIGHAQFGEGGLETRRLVESMLAAHVPTDDEDNPDRAAQLQWVKDNMLFDGRAALYTDAGRFDDAVTGEAKYAAGETDVKGLFNAKRAPQSHAIKRALINQIKWFYGRATNKQVFAIMDLYLPQELFNLTKDTDGATLQAAADKLAGFPAMIDAIDGYIRQQKVANPRHSKPQVANALQGLLGAAPGNPLRDKVHQAISDARGLGEEWADVLDIAKAAGKAIGAYLEGMIPADDEAAGAGDGGDDL